MGKKLKQLSDRKSNQGRYISRGMALRKLQMSLKLFRKLCILKGVYPRVPKKNASRARARLYYLHKDIRFLMHDPLVADFRRHAVYMKSIERFKGRRDYDRVEDLRARQPRYTLHHVLKERYPLFVDALRDLDDALSMVFLMRDVEPGALVTPAIREECEVLAAQWDLYILLTRSLRRAFISVRGFYFQAEVHGTRVTWLVPHHFVHQMPTEARIDFNVMKSFLELHRTLLAFVLFRLYAELGLTYPPGLDYEWVGRGDLMSAFVAGAATMPVIGGRAETFARLEREIEARGREEEEKKKEKSALKMREREERKREEEREKEEEREEEEEEEKRAIEEDIDEDDVDSDEDDEDDEAGDEDEEMEDEEGDARDKEMPDAVLSLDEKLRRMQGHPASAAPAEPAAPAPAPALPDLTTRQELRLRSQLRRTRSEVSKLQHLFDGLHFWVSREAPRGIFHFLVLCFGGEVSYERCASGLSRDSPLITHEVVDRDVQLHRHLSRVYVQPQWLFDCVNEAFLLPEGEYAPGASLPDHLSPFVNDDKKGYVPKRREELVLIKRAKLMGAGEEGRESVALVEEDALEELEESEAARLRRMEAEYAAELAAETQGGAVDEAVRLVAEKFRQRRMVNPVKEKIREDRKRADEEYRLTSAMSNTKRKKYLTMKKRKDKKVSRNQRKMKRARSLAAEDRKQAEQ